MQGCLRLHDRTLFQMRLLFFCPEENFYPLFVINVIFKKNVSDFLVIIGYISFLALKEVIKFSVSETLAQLIILE